jgi:hypothetical protein
MSIHIIVQLLSDNTAIHNMYLKMIVGTLADILQFDNHEFRATP